MTHQLRSTEVELTSAKNNWPPWLSKTLTSIKEVANKKDFTHFPYVQNNIPAAPTFISHINATRRDSAPIKNENCHNIRKDSVPILKDSQSCSSLKSQN